MLRERRHGWLLAGIVALLVGVLVPAAASGAGDTITVALPSTLTGGTPFTATFSGTMGESLGYLWLAFDPTAEPCPSDPTQSSYIEDFVELDAAGPYSVTSDSLTLPSGPETVCAWLTDQNDPTDVFATYGPIGVTVANVDSIAIAPATPLLAGQPQQVAVSGVTDGASTWTVTVDPAAAGCAASAEADSGTVLGSDYPDAGPWSAQLTPALTAGSWVLCGWIEDDSGDVEGSTQVKVTVPAASGGPGGSASLSMPAALRVTSVAGATVDVGWRANSSQRLTATLSAGAGACASSAAQESVEHPDAATVAGGASSPLTIGATASQGSTSVTFGSALEEPVSGHLRTLSPGLDRLCAWAEAGATTTGGPASTLVTVPADASLVPPGDGRSAVASWSVRGDGAGALALHVSLRDAASVIVTLDALSDGGARARPDGSLTLHGARGHDRFTLRRWHGHPLARGAYVVFLRTQTTGHPSKPLVAQATVG